MTEPEFTLDWPHGWKLRGYPESEVTLIGKANHTGSVVFEIREDAHPSWGMTVVSASGRYIRDCTHIRDIINRPAPAPQKYQAHVFFWKNRKTQELRTFATPINEAPLPLPDDMSKDEWLYKGGALAEMQPLDDSAPAPRTIRIGEYDVPEPLRVAPKEGTDYWLADPADGPLRMTWDHGRDDRKWLRCGLIHSTEAAALLHAEALLSLTRSRV